MEKLHDICYVLYFKCKQDMLDVKILILALAAHFSFCLKVRALTIVPFPNQIFKLLVRKLRILFLKPLIILCIVFIYRPFIRTYVTPLVTPYLAVIYLKCCLLCTGLELFEPSFFYFIG